MSEIKIQAEVFKYIWNAYPQTRLMLFHVPNGGKRGKIEAVQLKASGVIRGVPDLLLLWNRTCYPIEMKDEGGYLSDDQKKLHSVWSYNGFPVKTFYNAIDAITYIESIILD